MSDHHPPTLEDLRKSAQPAWLWDGARGRLVWANAAGISLFEGQSLFDLIDRTFDPKEPGVARIAELTQDLSRGEEMRALLHFPSAGLVTPLDCRCLLHSLADGRPGLLVLGEAPKPVLGPATGKLADQVVATLPVAVMVLDANGEILHANAAAQAFVPKDGDSFGHLIHSPVKAAELLSRLAVAEIVNGTVRVERDQSVRDLKLVLRKLEKLAGTQTNAFATLLLEDVTERRALERQMLEHQSDVPLQPSAASRAENFEALGKSIAEAVRKQSGEALPVQQASDEAPLPKPDPAPVASRKLPYLPDAIRATLEGCPDGLLVARDDRPLFVSVKASKLLHRSVEDIVNDEMFWKTLASLPDGAILPSVTGSNCSVLRTMIPWHNGPAQQFALRPVVERPHAIEKPAVTDRPHSGRPLQSSPQPKLTVRLPSAPEPQAEADDGEQFSIPPSPANGAQPEKPSAADDELRAILDVASDGIITLDKEGRILSFSAGAEAIFGLNASSVIGTGLAELLTAESRKSLRDYLAALSGPGLASVFNDGREVTAATRQGGTVPLFLTIGKMQSPAARAAFCVVVRDITSWKRTEKELREAKEQAETASRQKSEFLARISHELRTPLNAIMGFSEVMQQERFGALRNEKYKAYANDIHTSGSHLLSLINDLLDLSKVEAGKLELDFTAVSLEDAADHGIKLLQPQATAAGILVRKSFPAKLPRVVADHRALKQIVLNLLSNAIKYTNAGGEVIISASFEKNGEVKFRVKDSGIGMTDSQVAEALQPFTRLETPGRERQGTGLGLPLTKALVEANRARFQMSSAPGKGTLAEIIFPGTRVLAD